MAMGRGRKDPNRGASGKTIIMKTKNVVIVVSVVVVVIILFYGFQGSQDDPVYIREVEQEREDKDRFMRTSRESPFSDSVGFKGLVYYPVDPRFRIVADLKPVGTKKPVVLTTNDGKEEHYLEYAHAAFNFGGVSNKLLILEIMDSGPFRGKLFLAFGDETSAGETYGGGRYLDVQKVPGSSTILLDFNKAYNPYCAYNTSYSCPLPPSENLLTVAITAGEKNYSH